MKKILVKCIIFLSTICIGYLISGNANFDKLITSFRLNSMEYQKAMETKNNLLKEIGSLKSQNEEISEKIRKYNSDGLDNEKVLEKIESELKYNSCFTGVNKITGAGIIITINDGIYDNTKDSKNDLDKKTLHDRDMINIINDLKSVGAEAISVNGHRITPLSALTCKYAFFEFQDGDLISAPFKICAIGDGETMESLLLQDGSVLKNLRTRGLSVDLAVAKNIVMNSNNYVEMQYAKEYTKNN